MIEKSRLGPFVLEQRLGSQRSGSVYHGIHKQRRRSMAVRIMSQHLGYSGTTVQEFAKEVEFLKTLEHPNVVRVYGGGVYDEEAYLATELVKGQSLDELIARGPLPWETAVEYISQACTGLEYAHHRGTVHQNLTTAKLILADDGRIKITDFRGNRLNQFDRWNDAEPRREVVGYLAPEQLRGERSVSPKADLYSLGCILYELLTGHLPFQAQSAVELRDKHLNETPPPIRTEIYDCPIWLESLVAQMLEKDPSRRPHFASSVQVALEEVKQNALGGAGVVHQAVRGASSALRAPEGHSEVRRLLRRKTKARQEWVPFYERAWFLAGCGIALIALLTWAFWPLSEDQLFARAQALMASKEPSDWQKARDEYLDPLLAKHPNSKYAAAAQTFLDKIEIEQAKRRFDINLRLGREPRTVAERRYLEAWRHEQAGESQAALEALQELIAEVPAEGEDAPFVKLAAQRAKELEERQAALETQAAATETADAAFDKPLPASPTEVNSAGSAPRALGEPGDTPPLQP